MWIECWMSMPGNKGDHDDQHKVQQHGDAEPPGHHENPRAVVEGAARWRIGVGRSLGCYQTHRDAQAQGRQHGGALHFNKQRGIAAIAEHPCLARFRNAERLLDARDLHPGATPANGTADRPPPLAPRRGLAMLYARCITPYSAFLFSPNIFHVSLSFLRIEEDHGTNWTATALQNLPRILNCTIVFEEVKGKNG